MRTLASLAKISASTITKLERGQRGTRALVIQELAKALGVPESWLRDGTEIPPPVTADVASAPGFEVALGALAGEMRRHHDSVGRILNAIEDVRRSLDRGRADRLRRGGETAS